MGMGRKQGETVRFAVFLANGGSTQVPFVFGDSNGNLRTLQLYERFILDSCIFEGLANATMTLHDPVAEAIGTGPSLVMLFSAGGSLDGNSTFWDSTGEGISFAAGSIPTVNSTSSLFCSLSGTGRIITGKTRGVQAGYKALLTAGGNGSVNNQ